MSGEVTAEHLTEVMAACISVCGDCHDAGHSSSCRIRALADCKQLCDVTRDALLRGSPLAELPLSSQRC